MNDLAGHTPVLVHEVIRALVRGRGGRFLDGTVGLGGHAEAILLASGPEGRLLGVDLDRESVTRARQRLSCFGDRAVIVQGDYAELPAIARKQGWPPSDGAVVDLGLSSWLLEGSGRGFSFQRDEPLDMRFDASSGRRAEDWINSETQGSLMRVLRDFGEEPLAPRLARAIVARRARSRLTSTVDLRALVLEHVSGPRVEKTLARVFQSIRIAVNDELSKLQSALPVLVDLLRPGGRLAVIAYHSIESRLIKEKFLRLGGQCVCPRDLPVCGCNPESKLSLVGRAVRPSEDEVRRNPRARSAVLRVIERLPEDARTDGAERAQDGT